jgi:hypothetical protein
VGKKTIAQDGVSKFSDKRPNHSPGVSVPCPPGIPSDLLFPEQKVICEAICACDKMPAVGAGGIELRQICVSRTLSTLDNALQNKSTIKPEVPYDMTKRPPAPIMSRSNSLKPTRYLPGRTKEIPGFKPGTGMVRRPDVVIVNDPEEPPTQQNIRYVVEIKFPPDVYSEGQKKAYEKIAGGKDKLVTLGPDECGCSKKPKPKSVPVPVPVPAFEPSPERKPLIPKPGPLEVFLLALGVTALVLDDLLPTGATQADDVAIPAMLARLGMAFAK